MNPNDSHDLSGTNPASPAAPDDNPQAGLSEQGQEPRQGPLGEMPGEFLISRGLWSHVAPALARGDDPGPRPPVFSPDRVEALARTAPDAALRAARAAVGWVRARTTYATLPCAWSSGASSPVTALRQGRARRGRARPAPAWPSRPAGTAAPGHLLRRRRSRWVPIWPHLGPLNPAAAR